MLTQAALRKLLDYDPSTGLFRWKRCGHPFDGLRAGSPDKDGYTRIRIRGVRYAASRLAFLWMIGRFPSADCDHANGNPRDDRWPNLREATTVQNLQNKRIQSNNTSGFKGVCRHVDKGGWTGKWRARIKFEGKYIHLGLFENPIEAHRAYVAAADKYFGEFARAA